MKPGMVEDVEAPAVDPDAYRAFVDSIEFTAVETVHVAASRLGDADSPRASTEIEPSFAVDAARGAVFYRYELRGRLFGDDDDEIATVETTIVLVYTTEQTDVDQSLIERFSVTSGFLMVHPYLREALSSLAARIGFPNVVLPLIKA